MSLMKRIEEQLRERTDLVVVRQQAQEPYVPRPFNNAILVDEATYLVAPKTPVVACESLQELLRGLCAYTPLVMQPFTKEEGYLQFGYAIFEEQVGVETWHIIKTKKLIGHDIVLPGFENGAASETQDIEFPYKRHIYVRPLPFKEVLDAVQGGKTGLQDGMWDADLPKMLSTE
ncbi:MAG: hypothetical protein AABY13_02180 [Nanoarchaeota archaeon]